MIIRLKRKDIVNRKLIDVNRLYIIDDVYRVGIYLSLFLGTAKENHLLYFYDIVPIYILKNERDLEIRLEKTFSSIIQKENLYKYTVYGGRLYEPIVTVYNTKYSKMIDKRVINNWYMKNQLINKDMKQIKRVSWKEEE